MPATATDKPQENLLKLVYLFAMAEFVLLTFFRDNAGPYISPVLFYLSSVLLCWFSFRFLRDRPFQELTSWRAAPHKGTVLAVAVVGFVILLAVLRTILKTIAIDPALSDIIPSVQLYVQRLLQGQPVYATIHAWGKTLAPTYLPMQWLPFTLAELLHTDYRRIAFFILLIGFAFYLQHLVRLRVPVTDVMLKAMLPFGVTYVLLQLEPEIAGHTIEPMVYGYYLVLVAGIYSRSTALRAAGLVLCLLSRFSLLFWVPLFFALIWFEEKPRKAITLAGLVVAGVLAIYVIPFMSSDWLMFFKGQQYYKLAAIGEWEAALPERPYHLFRGVGFAALFYSFVPGSMAEKVSVLQVCHLLFSVLSVGLAGWLFYRWRGRIDYRYFALISFKFYLATFYAFIQVPYVYLNALQLFVTLWLLLHVTYRTSDSGAALAVAPRL